MIYRLALTATACWTALITAVPAHAETKISVLIIDGQNNHRWQQTTPLMKSALESCSRFRVDVATSPPQGGDMSSFEPRFAAYDVVLSNYNGQPWSEKTQQAFIEFVKSGGGFVCVHAANNSFPEWKEYNRAIGLGGWGDRTERHGPYVYYDAAGQLVRDPSPGRGGNHGPRHPFPIVIRDSDHPITQGMNSGWLHAEDELYDRLRGPAENMHVLATAFAPDSLGGRNLHEPMMMTIQYGDGRVFHTPMGHDTKAMKCVGFITTLQRGCEWVATGRVSIPIPKDFPTADATSSREDVSQSPSANVNAPDRLQLQKGDHICVVGNTLAERMQYFNHFETLLHSRFADHDLVFRNLGWSADEVSLRPRSLDFDDHGHTLFDHKADVILACFGFNESFAGKGGIAQFKADLVDFVNQTRHSLYNGHTAPRLVLISPIAHEDLQQRSLPDGDGNNENISIYTLAMREVAAEQGVQFVDLFTPTKDLMQSGSETLTINGIHLNDRGYQKLAPMLEEALFGPRPNSVKTADLAKLHAEIAEKNQQFFYDYRATNGYYIYGGRKAPFGVVNFPHEFAKLRKMIAVRDERVWKVARNEYVSDDIDDSGTGELPPTKTNFADEIVIHPPESAIKSFSLPDGYQVNLFASEVEFPELKNPVQMAFDARGRLWVCVMPSYPMYLPGVPVKDKLLILEDTNNDGRADKSTVFSDNLHIPTGFELGDGGVYVAQQPNVEFLQDTDGDDRADVREMVLHGFDSADSHHSISAFTWGPGGALYFQEGTFHVTSVETPYGPVRNAHGGVYRYEPRSGKFETFVHYNFANPWGHVFDRWGQNFVADASGGANYFGTAFSGRAPQYRGQDDFGPFKFKYRKQMKQFIEKRVRPTSGCEFLISRHFPPEAQGWFLLNNCIGEQSLLRHVVTDEGSGFVGTEVMPPLLKSSDRNFRPVDVQIGLDGAIYVVDWFNPLVGHMQHSLRDPNRDHNHGRIWRVSYKGRPPLEKPHIAGASIPELLDLLRSYEDRVRYHVRRELRNHDSQEVAAAVDEWLAGLDENHDDYEHCHLEALWVCQHHDLVDEPLLQRVLTSPDPRARAAATRVFCYWRDRVSNALEILQRQASDEHPRVALEAVRAASFFTEKAAADAALSSLRKHGQDYYIRYTLAETLSTLRPFTKK